MWATAFRIPSGIFSDRLVPPPPAALLGCSRGRAWVERFYHLGWLDRALRHEQETKEHTPIISSFLLD